MAVKLEDKPEAQCVGKRIPVGAATRWKPDKRSFSPITLILEPTPRLKYFRSPLTGVPRR